MILRLGRDDQISVPALPFSPAAHRLDEERAIDDPLQRPRIIDDRRIHLENGERAGFSRGENAFPTEVVVALDDDVRSKLPRARCDGPRAKQPQPAAAERRRHRVPVRPSGRASHRCLQATRARAHHARVRRAPPQQPSRAPIRHGRRALTDRWPSTESSS